MSEIEDIERPAVLIARRDESLPAPGPFIKTSTVRIPRVFARRAASSTAKVAA